MVGWSLSCQPRDGQLCLTSHPASPKAPSYGEERFLVQVPSHNSQFSVLFSFPPSTGEGHSCLSTKMTAAEASVEMLKADPELTDGLEKAGPGKTLQRNFLPVTSPVTSVKGHYWRVFSIFGLITIFIALCVIISVVLILAKKTELNLENPVFATCPKDWIGFGNKCFYFSEDIGNWTFSQAFCASLEARLAQFESQEELNFLKRYKGLSDHWIGLNRKSSHHIWTWTDETEYKASFSIKGVGECAYLNDNGISSARHYTDRKWICSKPNSYVHKCGITSSSLKINKFQCGYLSGLLA